MLPFLMIFFIAHLFNKLKKRQDNYNEILDPNQKTSIFQCFQRAGLKSNKLQKRVISYRMIESVVIDFKSCYPNSFDFQQMERILQLCQSRLRVDEVSRLEDYKESYFSFYLWECNQRVTALGATAGDIGSTLRSGANGLLQVPQEAFKESKLSG